MLSDDGTLYYPEANTWRDSKQDRYLWSPPKNYSPFFISHDHRFWGSRIKKILMLFFMIRNEKRRLYSSDLLVFKAMGISQRFLFLH